MNTNLTFNIIAKKFLPSLFAEYFIEFQKKEDDFNIVSKAFAEKERMLTLVNGRDYRNLRIRVHHDNVIDKIDIIIYENTENFLNMTVLIDFNFNKNQPSFNFKCIDESIQLRLPDRFELEK